MTFQSAHTIGVGVALTTELDEIDYIVVDEAEWDVAGWANQRLKGLNIGMMTSNADASIYRLAHNGASDVQDIAGVDAENRLRVAEVDRLGGIEMSSAGTDALLSRICFLLAELTLYEAKKLEPQRIFQSDVHQKIIETV